MAHRLCRGSGASRATTEPADLYIARPVGLQSPARSGRQGGGMGSVRTKIACLAVGAAAIAGLSLAGTAASAPPFALEFAGPGTPPPGPRRRRRRPRRGLRGQRVGGGRHREPGRQVRLQRLLRRGVHAARGAGDAVRRPQRPRRRRPRRRLRRRRRQPGREMDLGGRHVRTYGAGALTSASDVAVAADGVVHVVEAGGSRASGRTAPPFRTSRCRPPPSTGATSPSPPRASST